jgi:hypothetical protein
VICGSLFFPARVSSPFLIIIFTIIQWESEFCNAEDTLEKRNQQGREENSLAGAFVFRYVVWKLENQTAIFVSISTGIQLTIPVD